MKTKLLILVLIIAVPSASIAYFVRSRIKPRKFVSVEVTRGPFEVTVLAKGKLVAAKSIAVSCPVSWKPIVWLIPEGTMVKKGEIIVKFDKREIEDGLRSVRAWHRIATAQLRQAEQQLKAAEQELRSRIKSLAAQLHISELEVKDLKNRPRPDDLKRAEIELNRARAVLDAAKAEYEAMKQVSADESGGSAFTPGDLRAVRLTYEKALEDLKASDVKHRSIKAGSHPDTIEGAALKAKRSRLDLEETEKELPEKIKQLSANIEKAKADVDKAENQLKRNDEELADSDYQSPAAGMIAYRAFLGKRLTKGMTMWKGGTIMDLPDLSRMHLKTRVRESEISKIDADLLARVRIDGIADRVFDGKVVEIGKVAKDSSETEAVGFAQERKDTGVRVFDVIVEIGQSDDLLKPNMVGRAEVVVWFGEDVVSVPKDAVFTVKGETVAYILNGGHVEPVGVKTGKQNADRVVIDDGLKAGQLVCLREVADKGGQ